MFICSITLMFGSAKMGCLWSWYSYLFQHDNFLHAQLIGAYKTFHYLGPHIGYQLPILFLNLNRFLIWWNHIQFRDTILSFYLIRLWHPYLARFPVNFRKHKKCFNTDAPLDACLQQTKSSRKKGDSLICAADDAQVYLAYNCHTFGLVRRVLFTESCSKQMYPYRFI